MYKTKICDECKEEYTPNSGMSRLCQKIECKRSARRKTENKYYHTIDRYKERVKNYAKIYGKKQREERREWLVNYKKNQKCTKCGMNDYRCLEFHHMNPQEKRFNIPKLISNRVQLSKIQREISKCIILCKNCHAILHYLERGMHTHSK